MLKRRQIREMALQAVYAWLVSQDEPRAVFDKMLKETYQEILKRLEENPSQYPENDAQFLHDLFFGVTRNYSEYMEAVQKKLKNWDIERVAWVDKAAILLALCEMTHFPSIPVKVTISEYLDIIKNFSTSKSIEFVNGVVDAIHLEWKKAGKIQKI